MSLKNQHIIIFSQFRFDGMQSASYRIAQHLAEDNFVYYIDRPYTWWDYIKFRGTPGFNIRKSGFFSSARCALQSDIPTLKNVIMPPVPSINFLPEGKLYRFLLKFNEWVVGSRLKKLIRNQGIANFVYVNSYNFQYPTLHKQLSPLLTVYQCVDPLIEPYQTKHGVISENILLADADLVLCTSKALLRKHLPLNSNIYFVPNAADIQHSQKALDAALPEASVLAGIKKPIVGFFGNIERRIDYQLVKQLVEKNKDKSFVFVGPCDPYYIQPDSSAPNLYFTGEVPYQEMPAVLKGFDVAIIPFKKDEVSATIFPLKLFEYLGSGKPVVSTDFNPELADYTHDTVAYCSNAQEFTTAIEKCLNDTASLQQERLLVAADNTWEHRIVEIKERIQTALDTKKGISLQK